ncbi:DUF1534 domain-containing protein [Pseudomonas congelans]|nr:DUF1534 domain-containing protein [Pseudomonas congelans]
MKVVWSIVAWRVVSPAERLQTRSTFGRLSFLTLQRGNAVRDAPGHTCAAPPAQEDAERH